MVKPLELLHITLHQINTYCGSNCTAWNIKYIYNARVEKYRYSQEIKKIIINTFSYDFFKVSPFVKANF